MLLHNELIEVGNSVYDVSARRGVGTVVRVSQDGIDVTFANRVTLTYTETGVQKGQNMMVLFWHNPIADIPAKDIDSLTAQREIARAVRSALVTFRSKVVGI